MDIENNLTINKSNRSASSNGTAVSSDAHDGGGLDGWLVALILAGVLFLCFATGVAVFIAYRRARERRKNHGEYRPQQEEQIHAKDLPYITPPNIEGLI